MTGIQIIEREQKHQREKGFTEEHDSQHVNEELASAGAFYALPEKYGELRTFWNFDNEPRKHRQTRLEQLAIAGAFIASEIDRLNRNAQERAVENA